ncbi:MAG: shikimate dehydrogenase [Thermodesulfobacteriota bacterium]
MVAGTTTVVGIVGCPVSHSLSPAMHNAAFKKSGLDWVYVPFRVEPDALSEALSGLPALGVRGVNVTVPHKERVMEYLHSFSPEAQAIGAVNTVSVERGALRGDNTDWLGFLRDIQELGIDPGGLRVLILGAGGAARAVGYALAISGARLIMCSSRNSGKGEAMARDLRSLAAGCETVFVPSDRCARVGGDVDIVVNSTPLGMAPMVEASPWPEEIPFPRCKLAYDLVYAPALTRFMEQGKAAGATAANGLGMLVYQAAESFRIWTGMDAPVDVMRGAAARLAPA